MKFNQNLQTLRQQRQISQEQLAEQLNVSRQAISKWESGDSYPDVEKIILICELFDCKIDDLLMGEIKNHSNTKTPSEVLTKYNRIMNQFSRNIAIAVGLCIFGVAAMLAINAFGDIVGGPTAYFDVAGIVAFLFCVVLAMPFFITSGLKAHSFQSKYPIIEERFPETEVEQFEPKFITCITIGVVLCLVGVITLIFFAETDLFSRGNPLPAASLLFFVSIAAPIMVYAGIQKSKYNLKEYNQANSPATRKNELLIGKICGVIMLSTTIIFMCLGFIFELWSICWIVYPIAGICCGIVGTILGTNHH